jgi:hypothetical protein
MLKNLFGSHGPSDLLILEDAMQTMQIKKNLKHILIGYLWIVYEKKIFTIWPKIMIRYFLETLGV